MIKILRLTRPMNLLMIALCMLLVRYCLIMPAFETEKLAIGIFPDHMSRWAFLALTFGTCLIAAAGNIINDRFDTVADAVNRPGKNIVGKLVSVKTAEYSYYILSTIGSLPGIYLGIQSGKLILSAVMPFCAFTLWMYSSYYKRRMFSGNLMIATLTFIMVMLPGLYEPNFYRNIIYLLPYGLLAFLITLAREIIKDIEDLEGDLMMECDTLPIRIGIKKSAWLSGVLLIFASVFTGFISWLYFRESPVVYWMNIFLAFALPLLICIFLTIKADEKSDFGFISLFLKIYLAIGLLSMFPFWYYFLR